MMYIIALSEWESNLDQYIKLSKEQDVIVKKNGKIVTMLTSPNLKESALDSFLSLSEEYQYVDYQRILDERERSR